MNYIKIRLFLINKIIESVNYQLWLLSNTKRHHNIFYIFLLESADPKTSFQIIFKYISDEKEEFKIKRIIDFKNQKYLIKWKKYLIFKNI